MASPIIDIHPHIISDDETRYPPAPLFGTRSEWSKERPTTVETLIESMNAAGVDKAAVVHSSTTYGFDNRYVVESCARFPSRLAAVGSVDIVQPDAIERIREWVGLGLAGLRLFTGGSTKEFDPSELEDSRSYPAWQLCAELGLPMCIQTGPIGLPQVTALAKRFPAVAIILDHLGRPDVLDGPPYVKAQSLFDLAPLNNIYLKLTPRIFGDVKKRKGECGNVFPASSGSLRCAAAGVGFELSDVARHVIRYSGNGKSRLGIGQRGRSRLDIREDRADLVSGTCLSPPGSELVLPV